MKRRIFSVLFALVLVLSLSLVTAVPAVADPDGVVLETWGDGIAEWSTTPSGFAGSYCVKLTSPGGGEAHPGTPDNFWTNSAVMVPYGENLTTLATIGTQNIIFRLYYPTGSAVPFGLLYLDTTLDGAVDVLLSAKTKTVGHGGPTPDGWRDGLMYDDEWSPVGYDEGTITSPATICGEEWGFQTGLEYDLSEWVAEGACWANAVVKYVGFGYCCSSNPAYVDDVIIDGTPYALEWTHVSPIQVDDDRVQYPDAPFQTIQGAIDCAIAGDIISVAPGAYTEDPVIDESLTLSGPNADISPNTGTRVDEATIVGRITVGATENVTIQGFDFTVTPGVAGIRSVPSHVTGMEAGDVVGLSILNNSFTATSETGSSTPAIELAVDQGNDITGLVIDDNLITDVRGIDFMDWNETVAVDTPHAVTITNNVIIGGSTTTAFAGISVIGVSGGISGNEISNTYDAGINVGHGFFLTCDNLTISNNTVTNAGNAEWGNAGAINLYSDCTDITITGNTLADSYDGITIKDVGALGAGIAVNYNDISGNSNSGITNARAQTLDAECNWWGDVAGPDTTGNTMHNPYESWTVGDNVTDYVDYLPWMIRTPLVVDFDGWNIVSWPIMGEEVEPPPPPEEIVAIYWFDSSIQRWGYDPYAAGALDAMYVKVTDNITFRYPVSSEPTFPSQKAMEVGWNFVGLAELYERPVDDALSDAEWGTGEASLVGYNRVISPSLNGVFWTYMREGTVHNMLPTQGYWVFMVNEGVLGGFTQTPIVEQEVAP